jgi:hypothetical protein
MGRLLFLPRFLQARYFCVRLGNVLSARYPQENGVPQASVLSVTLFAISINGLVHSVGPSVTSLYVDYVAIYYSSRSTATIERRLQPFVSVGSILYSTRLRGLHSDPCLFLTKRVFPFLPTPRFLGYVLHSKPSWQPHMRYLRVKCERSQNILKVLSGRS